MRFILRRGAAVGLVLVCLLGASGPGCGGSGGDDEPQPVDVLAQGRAVLGFLGGSTVEVYDVTDLSVPVGVATTTTGPTHDDIGSFEVPLGGVLPSDLYLFVIAEGEAFDVDADGVLDAVATPHLGEVHGLASGAQLLAGAINVSIVTEIAYQRAREYLAAGYPSGYVLETLVSWARALLVASTDTDTDVDPDDLVAFDPRTDTLRLLRPWSSFLTLRQNLLGGADTTTRALALSASEIYSTASISGTSDVVVAGGRAYVCQGTTGLVIYDLANPELPVALGTYDSPGSASHVRVVGTLAYVTDGAGGLQIVDVSNPASPVQAGTAPVPNAQLLEVVGSRAYVIDSGPPRLVVVDVSTPATASILGGEDLDDFAVYDLAVSGSYAYARLTGSIEVVDVSTATAPASLGKVSTAGSYGAIMARGTTLYVAAGAEIEMFDLSTPAAPSSVGTRPLPAGGSDPEHLVDLGDGRLAVSLGFDGIGLLDATSPRDPKWLGSLQVRGGAGRVAPGAGVLVSTRTNGGLHVHAAATPPPLATVAELDLPNVSGLDVVGDLAAVGVWDAGLNRLLLVDVSSPEEPVLRGSVDLSLAVIQDVLLAGNLAYVGGSALDVVDVSNPDAPVLVGGLASPAVLMDLALDTDVLYGAGGGDGLRVLDVSAPTGPTPIVTLDTPGHARSLSYDGGVLTLADGFNGLVIYDAGVPSAPVLAKTLPVSQSVGVAHLPGLTLVARFSGTGTGALEVVDHAPPALASVVATLAIPGNPEGIVVGGGRAFLQVASAVEVVAVGTPLQPVHVATLGLPVDAGRPYLAHTGRHLYVGGGSGGFFVFRTAHLPVP